MKVQTRKGLRKPGFGENLGPRVWAQPLITKVAHWIWNHHQLGIKLAVRLRPPVEGDALGSGSEPTV